MKSVDNLNHKSKTSLILEINSLVEELRIKDDFIATLQQQLILAKQRFYGRKSEKGLNEDKQQDLFDEAEPPENKDEIEDADRDITVSTYKRKKSGRKSLPKDLPRVQQIHDLSAADKICACGCELTKIGEEKSEQLDIIPAKIRVIENIKLKYACKKCEETIKTAALPKQPIPKSIATPGLLAHVLISKYKDHLPLYRQENIFQRMGVDIARNTLAHWVIKVSELLLPIYKILQNNIETYDIAYADETRVQVLKEEGRAAENDSYMWLFVGGPTDKRSIIYKYDPGRAHAVIENILTDFRGYLHCDGFAAYDSYAIDHEVKLVGCWMHARRRFAEIVKTTKSMGLAHEAINLIARLYKIEKLIKDDNYCIEKTYSYRQESSLPTLNKLKKWLDSNCKKVLPKSPIGQAIGYCLNQWHKLIRYVDDGRLEIDNGLSERAIKPFVIGRKNWLFCNSVAGVKASEIIYSIIETCNAHKIEPYAYLRQILTLLPLISTEEQLQSLMPYNYNKI